MGRKPKPLEIPDVWSDSVGQLPQRVVVREEPTRGWRLYLWWRVSAANGTTNWGKASLRTTLRDERGLFLPDAESRKAAAIVAASKKFGQLYGGLPADAKPVRVAAMTIGATEAAVTDRKKGLYPNPTEYRREVLRAVRFAVTVWGAEKPWTEIQRSDWVELMRERLAQLLRELHDGVSGTEHTIIRLITVVRWLNDEGRVTPPIPLPKKEWKEALAKQWREVTKSRKDRAVHQPRYTLEELLKIMAAAWTIDPRFGLLANLGVGLRLGQVRRAMRSDLVEILTEDGTALELTVHGAGKKGGAVVELTAGQRAVVERLLTTLYASLEAAWQAKRVDYPLFPAGRLMGLEVRRRSNETVYPRKATTPRLSPKMALDQPVSNRWWAKRWKEAERLAKVDDVPGRASYGGRRVVVDEALDREISDRALKSLGGWTSAVVPRSVYADQESRKGRKEARGTREAILGETTAVPIIGVHSGAPRTTDVPETERPAPESGTPGGDTSEGQRNL